MQVALTVWQGRISPLFDATRMLLIADIENNKIAARHYEPFDCNAPFYRASKLAELGVNTLICGGISDDFAKLIEVQGIQIIPFISGTVEEVLDAYINGHCLSENILQGG